MYSTELFAGQLLSSSIQSVHLGLGGIEGGMHIIVQCHQDAGMTHDVLQCIGIHSCICHSGAEGVPHGVRCCYFWQRFFVALVVLFYKALEHGIIVCPHFRKAVPVQEQELGIPINHDRFGTSVLFQHTLECLISGCGHGYLSETAVRLWRLNVAAVFCAS